MFTVCYYVYAACTHYGCVVKLENQAFEDIACSLLSCVMETVDWTIFLSQWRKELLDWDLRTG